MARKPQLPQPGLYAKDEMDAALVLHLGSMGFSARFPLAMRTEHPDLFGDAVAVEEHGAERIEQIIRDAMSAIRDRTMEKVDRIILVIDGADCPFSDNRDERLTMAGASAAARIGAQLIGCTDATYAKAEFGQGAGENRTPGSVFGFADIERLGRYLLLFEKHCIKVRAVVPSAWVLLQSIHGQPGDVKAVLQVGAYETTMVLCNPAINAVLVRYIPVGVLDMGLAVSKRTGASLTKTMENLAQQNNFSQLADSQRAPGGKTSLGMVAEALAPLAGRLSEEIAATLNFFDTDSGAGRPSSFALYGDAHRIKGLEAWISATTGVKVNQTTVPFIDRLFAINQPLALNVLGGASKPLFNHSKVAYSFIDGRFQPTASDADSEESLVTMGPGGRRGRRRRQGGGFLAGLFKPKTGSAAGSGSSGQGDARSDQTYFAVFFILLALIVYLGYGEVEAIGKKHRSAAAAFQQDYQENQRLRREFAGLDELVIGATDEDEIDKILWTEKFLDIAANLNQKLWLTDVYLNEGKNSRDLQVQTLVMEGAALPSSDGHIEEISRFIKALTESNFRTDFREITFGGSEIQESGETGIVRFQVTAWYDRQANEEAAAAAAANPLLGQLQNLVPGGTVDQLKP